MSVSSIGVLLPIIMFLVWFWAIHTGTGAFKFSKAAAQLSVIDLEIDNGVEYYAINNNWRDSFLRAVVLWGVYLAISSEVLSQLTMLSRTGIFAVWGVAFVATSFLLSRQGVASILLDLQEIWRLLFKIRSNYRFSLETFLILILLLYLGVTMIVALVAPPNTNDSLQYHMSRVMHWFQSRSLEHYATPIDRQIWMPIWSETTILHLFTLVGSDRLANLVQWFSMVTSLLSVSLIATWLGATRWGQLLAMLFTVTIPMGVLQSTSTQTDYVNSCWAVILAYFILRIVCSKQYAYSDLLWAGGAVGLGVLTKGTFYVYAFPFLAILAGFLWIKWGRTIFFKSLLSGIVLVILINAGVWARNIGTYRAPLGPTDGLRSHANEVYGVGPLLSNLIRNATIHLGTPYGVINGPIYDSVAWFHRLIKQDLNDPRTSMNEYWVKRSFQEDYAGNPWHLLSMIPTLAFVLFPAILRLWQLIDQQFQPGLLADRFNRKQVLIYISSVMLTFVLFALLYKWQRTGSRLQLPFFVLYSPIFGIAFESLGKSRPARIAVSLTIVLFVLGSARVLISNPSRQLLSWETWNSPLFENSRWDLLFTNYPEIKPAYMELANAVQSQKCKSIGLMLDSRDAEYPFWALLAPSGSEVRIEHLFSLPELSRYIHKDSNMCALICAICTEPVVEGLQRVSAFAQYSLYLPVFPSP